MARASLKGRTGCLSTSDDALDFPNLRLAFCRVDKADQFGTFMRAGMQGHIDNDLEQAVSSAGVECLISSREGEPRMRIGLVGYGMGGQRFHAPRKRHRRAHRPSVVTSVIS